MKMMKHALALICVCVVACGGSKKSGTTVADPDSGHIGGGGDPGAGNADTTNHAMVSNEKMDEINRMFERKGKAVSRCLAIVVDNKDLPKNSRGKITLEVTILTSGKVGTVKILKASLESKALNDCVIERVKEIGFPNLPKEYPTTYTYAFEAM
jgi:TonB family protein